MKRITVMVLIFCLLLCSCSSKSLNQLLEEDPQALASLARGKVEIVCKDYTVYNTGGGIVDAINATRYGRGLVEKHDRFLNYRFIVKDNDTGWLYIFESLDDIPIWAKRN